MKPQLGGGRQAITIEEASAAVPIATIRVPNSVRIGHVAVTCKPASTKPCRNVSQPVDVVPFPGMVSCCLNA